MPLLSGFFLTEVFAPHLLIYECFTLKVYTMDMRDVKFKVGGGGPAKLRNYTSRLMYRLQQKEWQRKQTLICKLKCEASPSKRHVLPSRRQRTSDSRQALPRYSWPSQMAPCHLAPRNKGRQFQVRGRIKGFL